MAKMASLECKSRRFGGNLKRNHQLRFNLRAARLRIYFSSGGNEVMAMGGIWRFWNQATANRSINPASQAIPDAVFRNSRNARPVVHRDLANARARRPRQDGHEPVKAVERKQPVQRGTLEDPQSAARVAKIHAQDRLAPSGRSSRRPAAKNCPPGHAHAADQIVALQLGQKSRQIGRVVLQIAVERRHDGRREPRKPVQSAALWPALRAWRMPAHPRVRPMLPR